MITTAYVARNMWERERERIWKGTFVGFYGFHKAVLWSHLSDDMTPENSHFISFLSLSLPSICFFPTIILNCYLTLFSVLCSFISTHLRLSILRKENIFSFAFLFSPIQFGKSNESFTREITFIKRTSLPSISKPKISFRKYVLNDFFKEVSILNILKFWVCLFKLTFLLLCSECEKVSR